MTPAVLNWFSEPVQDRTEVNTVDNWPLHSQTMLR